jgi:cephalosporin hydroxylase
LEVRVRWDDIPGWFQWRSGQEEAARHFPEGSCFVEVGIYLGRSLCSLADVAKQSGKSFRVIGVDTCRGSGPEGPRGKDYHGAAVSQGGGTFAGALHKNILDCGYGDAIQLMIADSVVASGMFVDRSLAWVHLDARHDQAGLRADIEAWLPKVRAGGWLSGDDYDDTKWPEVVKAVDDLLPGAKAWPTQQWRWIVV